MPFIQAKLKLGTTNDRFEQEADRVADEVVRMPDSTPALGPEGAPHSIQRACAKCSEEDEGVQRKPVASAALPKISAVSGPMTSGLAPNAVASVNEGTIDPTMEQAIQRSRGGGVPLPRSARGFLEPRFGRNLCAVRIHTDSTAGDLAQRLESRAFTVGSDIFFAPGEFRPRTPGGLRILSHEVTHAVQQGEIPTSHSKSDEVHSVSSGQRLLSQTSAVQRKPGIVQFKAAAPKVPAFRDCTEATTWGFSRDPKGELESALKRARDYVEVAASILTHDPARYREASAYRMALARHFMTPSDQAREKIRANYSKILKLLVPGSIRCAGDGVEACEDGKMAAAFMSGGELVLCGPFWTMSHKCRAMVLIHEAAHAAGIGMGSPHPPYRASTEYPFGAVAPAAGQSSALRMDNPDAYSFFAAHVWREIDTECFTRGEMIMIHDSAPSQGP